MVLTESQLRTAISKIISEALSELSPEFFQQQADKADAATTGFKGKINKVFRPDKYAKWKRQGDVMHDWAEDHPDDDIYDFPSGWEGGGDPRDGWLEYSSVNARTGKARKGEQSAEDLGPDGHFFQIPRSTEYGNRETISHYQTGDFLGHTFDHSVPRKLPWRGQYKGNVGPRDGFHYATSIPDTPPQTKK